ncbi:MAG: hypothetical protein ACXU8A_00065 [Burkholderiaceae bacterium]
MSYWKRGEWVQNYTRRGAPRQGIYAQRWRSNKEKLIEISTAIVFAIVVVLAIVMPALINS